VRNRRVKMPDERRTALILTTFHWRFLPVGGLVMIAGPPSSYFVGAHGMLQIDLTGLRSMYWIGLRAAHTITF